MKAREITSAKAKGLLPIDRLRDAVEANAFARQARDERHVVLATARMMRDMRVQAGLTQTDLAAKLGSQQPNIARIERGEGTRGLTVDMFNRVAVACGQQLILGWAPKGTAATVLEEAATSSAHLFAM